MLLSVFDRCGLQVICCYPAVTADFVINPADVVRCYCGTWMFAFGLIMQICLSNLIFPLSDSTHVGCCIMMHPDSCLCVKVSSPLAIVANILTIVMLCHFQIYW
jgi:hypothetical protein